MQVRKILSIIGALLFLVSAYSTHAQVLTTNEDGEKIVVYTDGSWTYFDSLDEEEQVAIKESTKKTKKKKSKKDKNKKNKNNKVKTKDRSKSEKRLYSDLEEATARREAIQRADWAAMEEARTKNLKIQAGQELGATRKKLSSAYSNTDVSVEDLDKLDKKYKNQQIALNNAAEVHREAEEFLQKMESMIDMKKAKRDKMLSKLNNSQDADANNWTNDLTESRNPSGDKNVIKKNKKKENAVLVSNRDLILYPPPPPCELAYDGVDEFTGKRRWEMPLQVFFTHTSDRLKPFFKEKNHITVEGYLSGATGNGGTYYLNLNISILSELAQREFGVLEKASILTLKLLNGDNVKLFNTKTSTGTLDKVEKRVEYRAQYRINSDSLKSLLKSEVDKARIVWGTGYEDYEVYNLDFFIDQIDCLEKNK